jgi:hypothetical protein
VLVLGIQYDHPRRTRVRDRDEETDTNKTREYEGSVNYSLGDATRIYDVDT